MTNPAGRLTEALSDLYTIEREVGAGGMATVYLAQDKKHGRKVAIKVLRPELAAAMGADRFPREIRVVAQFNHPHILGLYDSGETQGFLYYVMPYVEGESLRDRLTREQQLPVQDAIRILREVSDALAYAHARGVVHRDIKPANILLSGRHAVVTDFGVAKALSASGGDKVTTVGIAVGTPQYMSPEQATGDAHIDHRADIYALGILGYEMLAGRPPFEANTSAAVLAAHVMEVPVNIGTLRPGLPPLLADVLMRCLAKNPADRWQSADELVTRLEMIASTPSGGVTPTDTRPLKATAAKPVASAGSRRGLMIGIGVAIVVLGGAFGAWKLSHAGAASGRIDKIGVMPIEDILGKDQDFVVSMQDLLTNSLTKLNVASVASRSVMMRYKGSTKPTRDIAKEAQLDALVEASVFRAGEVMRITVQLTDPLTSKALWSGLYERNVSNVLQAQKEIAGQIVAGIDSAMKTPKK